MLSHEFDPAALVATVSIACESVFHEGPAEAVGVLWQNRGGDLCEYRPSLLLCADCHDKVTSPDAPSFPCRACGAAIPTAGYVARWEWL